MSASRRSIHWSEYAIEAGALGTFMMSAASFAAALYHPSSPVAGAISNEWLRRGLMGLAMGSTAVSIIYSPWGQRSGAHLNPAVTLTFYRLGKVAPLDLIGYLTAQFVGAVIGIAAAAAVLGRFISDPAVNYVTTKPGALGYSIAFIGECTISFGMMLVVLCVSNRPSIARFTGACAGLLVWIYIVIEQPLSGMSMNPARTFGSALLARNFPGLWIYFTAPVLGMLTAAELYARRVGLHRVLCAKLHHPRRGPCIFDCRNSSSDAEMARSA